MYKKFIIGIDEVGRGALAGPVLVASVTFPTGIKLGGKGLSKLRDSKKLTPKQREAWFFYFNNHPEISYAVARVSPQIIDRKNVSQAANLAATRSLERLFKNDGKKLGRANVFLDGGLFLKNFLREKSGRVRMLIGGDNRINAIKAASIIAKVTRDRYMRKLHKKHPRYSFDRHKGYGTKIHKSAIRKYGPSDFHRLTFV